MKKLILATIIFTLGAFTANAQALKMGHLNYEAVMDSMPTFKLAKQKEEDAVSSAQSTLTAMEEEYTRKYDDYLASRDTLVPIIQAIREKELQEIQYLMQEVQGAFERDMGIIGERYYGPLEDWFNEAVEIVGKRKGLTYIIYETENIPLVWVNDEKGIDLTNEIITEMLRIEKENPIQQ